MIKKRVSDEVRCSGLSRLALERTDPGSMAMWVLLSDPVHSSLEKGGWGLAVGLTESARDVCDPGGDSG
jgi:hypothetical protein